MLELMAFQSNPGGSSMNDGGDREHAIVVDTDSGDE